ncbi:MAG: undecaprenyl/decaprenyl-phosphate alpha-N-acetylglucosaminyl 1-phosphate transferase [Thermodesulfobacteria bacterium]|nr:undecaprenyl/decaprenyl-phosphate alpha-N-acetylglucosaminyl 1-phosphate transferase [Thermodesulfobacteriota bacterium]
MSGITTALITFFIAMCFALVLTPRVASWAAHRGICDYPSARRVHQGCTPRAGGMALFLSFLAAYLIAFLFSSDKGIWSVLQREQGIFLFGACCTVALGLWDDIRSLPAFLKLAGQIAIGLLVWFGGIDVELFSVTLHQGIQLPSWLSAIVTVFWVVLLMNAMNLIDGLDGLAAGICLFVSITLLSICLSMGKPMLIIGFSALAGSCLGFLRYNFNPATVFMGDCGSYLLGYLLAALTIQGAVKSHATVALLIPIIALGVPLLDTLLAPVRRFILGKKMFGPDQSHIHHVLLKLGYSQRRVVMIIYGATVFLGLVALTFVFFKDQFSAYILVLPGILIFLTVKKLGYLEYVAADKIWGWLRDITDEAGLSNERRSFLNIQMQIIRSENVEELWEGVCLALEKLDFDLAELFLVGTAPSDCDGVRMEWCKAKAEIRKIDFGGHCQFKLEMPLVTETDRSYGILWLVKDLQRSNISHYTLRRVEHLRRTIISVLDKFAQQQ